MPETTTREVRSQRTYERLILTTEGGDVLTTEAGDTLVTEPVVLPETRTVRTPTDG